MIEECEGKSSSSTIDLTKSTLSEKDVEEIHQAIISKYNENPNVILKFECELLTQELVRNVRKAISDLSAASNKADTYSGKLNQTVTLLYSTCPHYRNEDLEIEITNTYVSIVGKLTSVDQVISQHHMLLQWYTLLKSCNNSDISTELNQALSNAWSELLSNLFNHNNNLDFVTLARGAAIFQFCGRLIGINDSDNNNYLSLEIADRIFYLLDMDDEFKKFWISKIVSLATIELFGAETFNLSKFKFVLENKDNSEYTEKFLGIYKKLSTETYFSIDAAFIKQLIEQSQIDLLDWYSSWLAFTYKGENNDEESIKDEVTIYYEKVATNDYVLNSADNDKLSPDAVAWLLKNIFNEEQIQQMKDSILVNEDNTDNKDNYKEDKKVINTSVSESNKENSSRNILKPDSNQVALSTPRLEVRAIALLKYVLSDTNDSAFKKYWSSLDIDTKEFLRKYIREYNYQLIHESDNKLLESIIYYGFVKAEITDDSLNCSILRQLKLLQFGIVDITEIVLRQIGQTQIKLFIDGLDKFSTSRREVLKSALSKNNYSKLILLNNKLKYSIVEKLFATDSDRDKLILAHYNDSVIVKCIIGNIAKKIDELNSKSEIRKSYLSIIENMINYVFLNCNDKVLKNIFCYNTLITGVFKNLLDYKFYDENDNLSSIYFNKILNLFDTDELQDIMSENQNSFKVKMIFNRLLFCLHVTEHDIKRAYARINTNLKNNLMDEMLSEYDANLKDIYNRSVGAASWIVDRLYIQYQQKNQFKYNSEVLPKSFHNTDPNIVLLFLKRFGGIYVNWIIANKADQASLKKYLVISDSNIMTEWRSILRTKDELNASNAYNSLILQLVTKKIGKGKLLPQLFINVLCAEFKYKQQFWELKSTELNKLLIKDHNYHWIKYNNVWEDVKIEAVVQIILKLDNVEIAEILNLKRKFINEKISFQFDFKKIVSMALDDSCVDIISGALTELFKCQKFNEYNTILNFLVELRRVVSMRNHSDKPVDKVTILSQLKDAFINAGHSEDVMTVLLYESHFQRTKNKRYAGKFNDKDNSKFKPKISELSNTFFENDASNLQNLLRSENPTIELLTYKVPGVISDYDSVKESVDKKNSKKAGSSYC